ncbi:MAG TPA: pseudouridine synthase, partial [Syntrophaceae bacterium]|nr:pseudouridine synthase [Syntrophaceae bacterium]
MKERLQKIISGSGISSRRVAEQMIVEGRVTVNNVVVRQLGVKADIDEDEIRVNGKLIYPETSKVYLMLHKPKGYVTTLHDPQGRPVVKDLIVGVSERLFPVGRLDYDSEGVLFMTNDGEFSLKIQHPRFRIPKTYMVKIEGTLAASEIRVLSKGVKLMDGIFKPDSVHILKKNPRSCWLRLIITEGKNRVIRRGFESLGHPVVRLIRTAISDVSLGNLKAGTFRYLTSKEVESL